MCSVVMFSMLEKTAGPDPEPSKLKSLSKRSQNEAAVVTQLCCLFNWVRGQFLRSFTKGTDHPNMSGAIL